MLTYKNTMVSCFIGYIVQAIVNNFIPLLFVTFQNTYGIPLAKITMLITFNFTVQILTDLVAAKYVDRIGYRAGMVLAHVFSALGLAALTVLPEIMDPFAGILIAVMIYAIGGGPTLVGLVSSAAGENLKLGILAAIVFPLVMVVCLMRKNRK